jgi:5-formyltetrahydrofolate cyclo-ligase
MNEKNIIRRKVLNRNCTTAKFSKQNINILNKIILNKNVCIYIPLSTEVSILDSLKTYQKLYTTYVFEKNLKVCLYKDPLIKGNNGVYEPLQKIDVIDTDIFIIPGIAFTKSGIRRGRGGGYYDKLLSNYEKTLKIGICHDHQILDLLPKEDHDILMDYVFTDNNYYKTST